MRGEGTGDKRAFLWNPLSGAAPFRKKKRGERGERTGDIRDCAFCEGDYLGSDAGPGCMCINGVWIGIRPLAGFVPVLAKEVQATVG